MISLKTIHPPPLKSTANIPILEGKVTQHHIYNHCEMNQFQLTRLEKVNMPLSCVRRLDRNIPPLRDKRTPARAWSSSDLICFWKCSSYKERWDCLMKRGSIWKPHGKCLVMLVLSTQFWAEENYQHLQHDTAGLVLCSQYLGSQRHTHYVPPEKSFSVTSQDMVGARTKYSWN